jgi:hypothetical protein
MLNGKVWYYADFAIYGALVVALSALVLGERRSDQMIWMAAASAGAGGWTLVEYLMHRFASSSATDRRPPPCPPCGIAYLCQHANLGESASSGSTLCRSLASVFARCGTWNNPRAHRGLALVRDCASCHPSSRAPPGHRPAGGVASTPSSSFPLSKRQLRCDDPSMGLPVWYSYLICGARGECYRTTAATERI